MKKIFILLLAIYITHSAYASNKNFVVAFSAKVENSSEVLNELKHCKGVLNATYCNEKNAFLLECDEAIYSKLELLELHVRPSVEKINKVKFYFTTTENSLFNNLNCN